MNTDLIVIGGGPGGYTAAIRAAQLGAKVTLITNEKVGGTCLNRGCIPTKALFRNAKMLYEFRRASEFGIISEGLSIDFALMLQRKQKIVERLTSGIEQLLKANAIELIYGKAMFNGAGGIEVVESSGSTYQRHADNIIIATGSVPSIPMIPGFGLPGVMTSDDILSLNKVPENLAVIGGGVIGVEFAGIFNSLGSSVTVIEFLPRILANFDEEISKKMLLSLKKKGISFQTGCGVQEITRADKGYNIRMEGKSGPQQIHAEAVLVSTGRKATIDGLNLDMMNVDYDKNGIKVDENYRTSMPGVYAIGDVIGGHMLAHVAAEEGKICVERMLGVEGHIDCTPVPSCVFSFPEAAFVGLSEEEAKIKGVDYKSSKFLFGANGKALTMGEEEGFVKILAERQSGKIIGVHIMGPHADDLIHEAVMAMTHHMTAEDVSRAMHAHPSLSETIMEAASGIGGKAIHMLPQAAGRNT